MERFGRSKWPGCAVRQRGGVAGQLFLCRLCFRNLPSLGEIDLQPPLVCHGELPRLDQRIVSCGERGEFLGGHRGEVLRAGGASNVAVQFPGFLHCPESVLQVGHGMLSPRRTCGRSHFISCPKRRIASCSE